MDLESNLEYDLLRISWIGIKCQDENYAQNLYAALCNNLFFKNNKEWSCSWRYSGGIVAELRNTFIDDWTKKEDYINWYCSGMSDKKEYVSEGTVTSEIMSDLNNLGWEVRNYEPKLKPGIYRNIW